MNRTIVRAVKILEMLSQEKEGLTLKEISDELEMPKSTTFEIVQTLVNLKLAEPSVNNNKRYVLGSKTFALGIQYISTNDIVHHGSYYLKDLAEKLNKTGFIGVLDGDQVMYVHKWQSQNAKLTSCVLGTKQQLYCTSLGKSLLAFLPQKDQEDIISRIKFVPKTEKTITNADDLKKELELTRQRGYSIDNREVENHMMCFGAPVFDFTGNVVAAISVSDLYYENEEENLDKIGSEVRHVADQISAKLGYNKRR